MLLGVTVPHFRLKHGTRMSDIPFALYGFNRHNVQSLKISSSQGTNHQSGCGCSAATPTLLAWHSPHLSLVALLCLGCVFSFGFFMSSVKASKMDSKDSNSLPSLENFCLPVKKSMVLTAILPKHLLVWLSLWLLSFKQFCMVFHESVRIFSAS